jgi:MFS family permease
VQWVVLAYLLAITTLVVGVGRLGDMLGRRRLLLAGMALFTAASMLCALAPTLWLLIAARAVQGLGAAVMMALTMALVGETVPKARTGSAMGLLGTVSAIGTALGPSLGGALIAAFGWQAIFLVNGCRSAWRPVSRRAATCPRIARRRRPNAPLRCRGTLLLALTLAAYALAMTWGAAASARSTSPCWRRRRSAPGCSCAPSGTRSPLIRWRCCARPVLGAGLAMSALVSTW